LLEKAGRTQRFRLKTLADGDRLFARFRLLAPVLAPAPVSGINNVALPVYAVATVVCALWWTLATGLAAFFLGDAAKEWLSDVGGQGFAVVAAVAVIGLLCRYLLRRRHTETTRARATENRDDGEVEQSNA
jgi:membrane protein DedA with SNARE-associated domain